MLTKNDVVNSNDLAVVDSCNSNCLSPSRLRPGILRRRCNEKPLNVLDTHSGRHQYFELVHLQCEEIKTISQY